MASGGPTLCNDSHLASRMSSVSGTRPLQIAIIGGGIAGLCLAGTLAKFDSERKLNVVIYEATSSFQEVGAGLTIWGRSFQVMHALGLDEELAAINMAAASNHYFSYRRSDQGDEGHEFVRRTFGKGAGYHRAQFRAALGNYVARYPSIQVEFNKKLVSINHDTPSEYQVVFKDGTTAQCDVIFGTDGIRSRVRDAMLRTAATSVKRAGVL
ncbi:FAD/NAD(P)-binding domain-containing protein [Exidia glandulosa HHB12029]|uniref:FAD/NAD(P)-binding domain-containing protein n=1 Tax=Exidia glandulosa HHB12029 TaxID=1314781 RepID=A0A166A3H3_EXIGL|nr:FAD/NAD(P)-binding domain-containing protein [Exidia glandulosa HHB12029]